MANKHKEMQFVIREWMKFTGKTEIDMKAVAIYAINVKGWPSPAAPPLMSSAAKPAASCVNKSPPR